MTNKPMYDWMDEHEGREVGSSYNNIQKERERQGYKKPVRYNGLEYGQKIREFTSKEEAQKWKESKRCSRKGKVGKFKNKSICSIRKLK